MNFLKSIFRPLIGKLDVRTFGIARDPKWSYVRDQFLKANPTCAVCETMGNLDVHHKVPVHIDFKQELEPSNLITLCRPHHFTFGHLDNWSSWNTNVVEDAQALKEKIKCRP